MPDREKLPAPPPASLASAASSPSSVAAARPSPAPAAAAPPSPAPHVDSSLSEGAAAAGWATALEPRQKDSDCAPDGALQEGPLQEGPRETALGPEVPASPAAASRAAAARSIAAAALSAAADPSDSAAASSSAACATASSAACAGHTPDDQLAETGHYCFSGGELGLLDSIGPPTSPPAPPASPLGDGDDVRKTSRDSPRFAEIRPRFAEIRRDISLSRRVPPSLGHPAAAERHRAGPARPRRRGEICPR